VVFADVVAAHVGAAIDRGRVAPLCDALERKDAYTAAHAHDVAELSEAVARRMGLAGTELRNVRHAALLHDVGKIGIRTEILVKPGALTPRERVEMQQHTLIGQRILEPIPFFAEVHRLVRWAHERWDGHGYPDGIRGADVPLGARIICACDAFHAMTSERAYRAAMPVADAVEEMRRNAGSQFDPEVVEALLAEAVGAGRRG